jgi:hypothetical protein
LPVTVEHAPRYIGVLIVAVLGSLLILTNYDPCHSTGLPWGLFAYLLSPVLALIWTLPRVSWRAYWTNGLLAAMAMAITAAVYSLPLENTGPCESPLHAGWHAWLLFWAMGGVISVVAGALLALPVQAIWRGLRRRRAARKDNE